MHINDILKVAVERKASDLHLKVGSASGPPDRRRAQVADRVQAADAGGHHRDGVLDDVLAPEGALQAEPRDRHRLLGARARPLPLQHLPAARLGRPGAAAHPGPDPDLPRADAAAGARADLRGAARAGAGHRHHRLGQVDDARGDDRLHQRPPRSSTSSRSRTRSSSCTATRSRSSTSARSRSTPAASRCALRSALRQDPDVILVGEMRDYETIETALLAAETGHLVLSTLHTLDATETDQPHHRGLPAPPAEADPHPARGGAQGGHLAAPAAARRRPRPGAGGRGADRHRLHPRLHREQGEDQATSATRSRRAPASTACRPSTSRSTSSTRPA